MKAEHAIVQAQPEDFPIVPSSKALAVIDIASIRAVIAPVSRALSAARKAGVQVI
jgi:hypothetical protein